MINKFNKTHEVIKSKWDLALRKDSNPDYPLPFPFVPPCINGEFKCMFYWDTFYTNRGMIKDGKLQYAIWNTNNLIHLLKTYGCVPNSNSYPGIKHNSQPPYLQYMIEDVYNETKDEEWLKDSYEALKLEYKFWMEKRMASIGLNQYLHHEKTDEEKIELYDYVTTRLNIDKNAPREFKIYAGSGFNADCEAGLDFSPRFGFEGKDMVEVDLNAHLYRMEIYLSSLARKFEPSKEYDFIVSAKKRKELMDKYLLCEDGLYYDYNFVKKDIQQKEFNFSGQFVPFIAGISKDKQALKYLLSKIEFTYGVASTSQYKSEINYQAAYPYSWPYDNGLAFWAVTTLELKDDIERIGNKYLEMCNRSVEKDGHLWETYSAISDQKAEKHEYSNQEMMGWTAGIFSWIFDYLSKL